MKIRAERSAIDGVPLLKVCGNLDFDTSGRLLMWADEAWDPEKKLLILDLQEVDHIDSAGITELVLIKKRARRQGGNAVILGRGREGGEARRLYHRERARPPQKTQIRPVGRHGDAAPVDRRPGAPRDRDLGFGGGEAALACLGVAPHI